MPTELFESADAQVEYLKAEANRFASNGSEGATAAAELAVDRHNSQETPQEDTFRQTVNEPAATVTELYPGAQDEAVIDAIVADQAKVIELSDHIDRWLEYLRVA
jgi:hypothetical protein